MRFWASSPYRFQAAQAFFQWESYISKESCQFCWICRDIFGLVFEGLRSYKTFIVGSMASFHFAVMPRSSWLDCLMNDSKPFTLSVKRMHSLCFLEITEWPLSVWTILDITEVSYHPSEEIDWTVRRYLPVEVNEPLSGGLIYCSVLIISIIVHRIGITFSRNVLDVNLDLFSEFFRSMVFFEPAFFLGFRLNNQAWLKRDISCNNALNIRIAASVWYITRSIRCQGFAWLIFQWNWFQYPYDYLDVVNAVCGFSP